MTALSSSRTAAATPLQFDFLNKSSSQQGENYLKRFLGNYPSSNTTTTTTMTIEIDTTEQENIRSNEENKEEEETAKSTTMKPGSEPELLAEEGGSSKDANKKGSSDESPPQQEGASPEGEVSSPEGGEAKENGLKEEVNGTNEGEEEENGAKSTAAENGEGEAPSGTTTDDTTNSTDKEEEGKEQENGSNAMALNVAYEALEQVRQANISIEFGRELGPKECVHCLREPEPAGRRWGSRMPKLSRSLACLTCGNPVCAKHRCPELKRENINICVDCAAFFSLDEFVTKIHDTQEKEVRRQQMNGMLDVYDRALLILQYSSQYIEEIAIALEKNTERNNKIGFGSSATGFVSGIAGVAAAVTIFTPAGPPLLIASILFGGGATAASASSEAVNYHCSANKMADTIYALHGMVHSISRLAIEGHLWEQEKELSKAAQEEKGGAVPTTTGDNNSAPATATTGNQRTHQAQARNWGRATANALKPLTAGALSAASVVMEAREMRNTLDKINAGNPCEKADSLRNIKQEMELLPSTSLLAEIAPRFFKLE